MKPRLFFATALSLTIIANFSIGLVAPGNAESFKTTQSASVESSGPDETKPIMTYCGPDLYACDGYKALSDEQYLPPWTPGFRNYQGFYHNDLASVYRFPSYAIAINRDSSGQATALVACKDIAASDCKGTEVNFSADLPMCGGDVTIDCMRDITITDSENKPLSYDVVGQFPVGGPQNFKGSPNLKVPNGTAPTLIRIPSAPHQGGDTYLIKPQMVGVKGENQTDFFMRSFIVSVSAVKIVDGKYSFGGVSTNAQLYSNGFSTIGAEDGTYPSYCAAASKTQCALRYSLPMSLHYGMTVDLSRRITGWLHGRVKAPIVSVSQNAAGGSTITISAEPIKVPVNAVWINNDNAPKSIKDFYAGKPNYGSPLFGNQNKSKPLSEIALMRDANFGHNQDTVDEYLTWLQTLGDKAQAMPTAWVVQTMSNYDVPDQIQKCLNQTDALAGIVTTNAAEYLDGPPVFDKKSGSLDYKVAATHFEPDGVTVFKGSYDLVMSSKVARCIYGFTNAPVSAKVSVTSDSGENNVATTVVSERNGWLSLGAYNFTYSSPTISVVLIGTPDVPVVIAPTPSATPKAPSEVTPTETPKMPVVSQPTKAPSKPVVKKITCTKGKIIKQVTGNTCPKGYVKKAS